MKKEARLLLQKATNSLVLSIEHFNRPFDLGRTDTVVILLDHAFEMLLKASIVQRGGNIRDKGANQTIGFDACVRRALSDGAVQFLSKDQSTQIRIINALRDAAYHHLIEISEQHLYMQCMAGITVFRDIVELVFSKDIARQFPVRALPIATIPPVDIATLFQDEMNAVRQLLAPGSRRRLEAENKLRSLAIVDGAIQDANSQPTETSLRTLSTRAALGKRWDELFPGVASVEITATGIGPSLELRITKKDGLPIHIVSSDEAAASAALKRVSELDYYSLTPTQLAKKLSMTIPKISAIVWHLDLKKDLDYFKEFPLGKTRFPRYSPKALHAIQDALKTTSIDEIWRAYRCRSK